MFGIVPYNRKNNGIAGRGEIWDVSRSIFEDFFNDSFFRGTFPSATEIRADIRENEKEYVVDIEVPGIKKEDIKLDLRDDVLTVSIDRNEEVNEEKGNYIRRERRYGSVSRSFYVENIKAEDVKAKYLDGILTVTLPKELDTKRNTHKIDIQ
ncbi:Hsp20/alpha crystallin family protein [Acetivibrio cellulolyticus]|uniref:Hsp20/alpha crystallin family protein n=1 Tax=Acetivibrio cellulolyticus TaxID=35830 RepID=UPI0001E2D190|nr:Hsp20/alpha crystallin family protein [Acetivibrio cellulolyticus]